MKLTVELVPGPSWASSLKRLLPKAEWDRIRKKTYAQFDHLCGICGADERLNCHEIWQYDDDKHIQKLDGFIALCGMCHHVKHIGLAGILAKKGKLDCQAVIDHFLSVNNCSEDEFIAHREQAFEGWSERSQYEWLVDLGEYANFIEKHTFRSQ